MRSAVPSIARGLAALAWLALIWVIGTGFVSYFRNTSSATSLETSCAQPVEVHEAQGIRLGCASDLPRCLDAQAGDRVMLSQQECRVIANGMSSTMRLSQHLPLDLNHASAADLAMLQGIGPRLAERIVAYRTEHQRFNSVAELNEVSGVGPKMLEAHAHELAVFELALTIE